DRPGQRPIGAAGEDQQVAVLVLHLRRAPLRSDRCGGGWVEPGLGSGNWGPKAKALAPAPDPSPRIPNLLAGAAGFEPANARIKAWCLRPLGDAPGVEPGFGIRDSGSARANKHAYRGCRSRIPNPESRIPAFKRLEQRRP